MEWEANDLKDASRINEALNDPNSVLTLFLQDLIMTKEKVWEKVKTARKEDNVWKLMGVMEGLDIALKRPQQIVSSWRATLKEAKTEREEVLSAFSR